MHKVKSIQAFVHKYGAKKSAAAATFAVMGASILISFAKHFYEAAVGYSFSPRGQCQG